LNSKQAKQKSGGAKASPLFVWRSIAASRRADRCNTYQFVFVLVGTYTETCANHILKATTYKKWAIPHVALLA
jgi:hypothetical protein